MAKLYIAEAANMTFLPNALGQMMPMPPAAEQTVAIGGGATQSAPFGSLWSPPLPLDGRTIYLRVHTDSICSIAWGVNPTATTANMRLVTNQTEYFGARPGYMLSVISNT
jgi:hypothetical protein